MGYYYFTGHSIGILILIFGYETEANRIFSGIFVIKKKDITFLKWGCWDITTGVAEPYH